jgi:hypothetical protein
MCWNTHKIVTHTLSRISVPVIASIELCNYEAHCTTTKVKGYPCNRPWEPIGMWDIEAPIFSQDNRLTDGGEVVSLRDWVHSRVTARLKGLGKMKNSMALSGLEHPIFRLVAYASTNYATACSSLLPLEHVIGPGPFAYVIKNYAMKAYGEWMYRSTFSWPRH